MNPEVHVQVVEQMEGDDHYLYKRKNFRYSILLQDCPSNQSSSGLKSVMDGHKAN